MNRALALWIALLLGISLVVFLPDAFCESPSLIKGIEQYKQENYEEAIELLIKARKETPKSSAAAFFLGLAYKQVMNYQKALPNLRDAVTLTPRIKEALVELIEVLYNVYEAGNLDEAKKWIQVAEKENIFPAKIAFLKGLVLQKEGKHLEAIESFKKAKALDETLTQAAEFQIGLCFVNERKLEEAKKAFQAAVLVAPTADLAGFARRYQDLVENRMFFERPYRFTLGLFGGYDTNVVLKPLDSFLAPDVTNEASGFLTPTLRFDYVPILKGPWLFNAQYGFSGTFYDKNSTTHNNLINTFYVAPGYNFGRTALNLPISYSWALVRDNGGFKKFLGSLNVGPLYRILLNQKNILELFAGYRNDEYFRSPLSPEEDRDADGLLAYLSWIWVFKRGAFFNLRYEFSDIDTDGVNWEYYGHRFSLNTTIPLYDKVALQLVGEAFIQNFKNDHTFFGVEREDENYRGSVGITWEFYKHTNLVLQAVAIRADSNIAIYDYDREIYSLGLEYRF